VNFEKVLANRQDVGMAGVAQLAELLAAAGSRLRPDVLVLKVGVHGDVSLKPLLANRTLEARLKPQFLLPGGGGQLQAGSRVAVDVLHDAVGDHAFPELEQQVGVSVRRGGRVMVFGLFRFRW